MTKITNLILTALLLAPLHGIVDALGTADSVFRNECHWRGCNIFHAKGKGMRAVNGDRRVRRDARK